MEDFKHRVFILLLLLSFVVVATAQNLVYSDLVKLNNMTNFTQVNNYLDAKGYIFSGKYNESDSVKQIVWTRNCVYHHYDESFEWNTGSPHSLFKVLIISGKIHFKLHVSSKSAFNVFLNAIKANGFKYAWENMSSTEFVTVYSRSRNNVKDFIDAVTQSNGGYYFNVLFNKSKLHLY